MKAVILAGGSGERLWPLSRKNYQKQFLKLNGKRSLLQQTPVRIILKYRNLQKNLIVKLQSST